ncbi:MAG: MFS transporter [Solirubrobacteraceae bacterium]
MANKTSSKHTPWSASVWALMVVLCGVLFLDGLDVSMIGVALPSIERELGLTTTQLQWVVSGYVLGYGGLLLLGGRAADLLGRRRVLLVALAIFTVASAIGALSDDGTVLILTRFLKGAAAAFTAPATLSIITTRFAEGPERNRALSIYTAVGASGFSLGLVLGGVLTEIGWRWTFILPVPIAAALLVAARRYVPRDITGVISRRQFDIPGALTLTAGMLLLVRTVVVAPEDGWGAASTVAAFAIAIALLGSFVAIELRSRHPLIRLGILRSPTLVAANLGAAAMFGSYIGFQFIMTLYLQRLNGWSAIEMALAFLPAGLLVAVGSTRIGPLVERFGPSTIVAAGSLSGLVGYGLALRIDAVPDFAAVILPTMILLGVMFMLNFPTFNIQATSGVGDHEQGLASGLVQTSFQVGGAVALAIVSAVATSRTGVDPTAADSLEGFRAGLYVAFGIAGAGLLVALGGVALERLPAGERLRRSAVAP